ncbi:MAG: hypothetical protein BWX64_02844 [Acidobacteria bacterium ADurb.Bin051]|nr:MAG: hypothetical protein BWX64_02844 [Acidobacteria bacterium ADurb.Bin051]
MEIELPPGGRGGVEGIAEGRPQIVAHTRQPGKREHDDQERGQTHLPSVQKAHEECREKANGQDDQQEDGRPDAPCRPEAEREEREQGENDCTGEPEIDMVALCRCREQRECDQGRTEESADARPPDDAFGTERRAGKGRDGQHRTDQQEDRGPSQRRAAPEVDQPESRRQENEDASEAEIEVTPVRFQTAGKESPEQLANGRIAGLRRQQGTLQQQGELVAAREGTEERYGHGQRKEWRAGSGPGSQVGPDPNRDHEGEQAG